jgi:AhpD family alkylhydroperoxidase
LSHPSVAGCQSKSHPTRKEIDDVDTTIQARINHPAFTVPDAMPALQALGNAVRKAGVPAKTLELISLRASQINGCDACVVQHPKIARKLGQVAGLEW